MLSAGCPLVDASFVQERVHVVSQRVRCVVGKCFGWMAQNQPDQQVDLALAEVLE